MTRPFRWRDVGRLVCIVAVLSCAGGSGCAKNTSGKWFEKPRTSREWMDLALEASSADERRRGVIGLARSADAGSDWAMKVFDTIARTDKDAMVRSAAVRAMWPHANDVQVVTLLKILGSAKEHYSDVRAATGPVRWSAAQVLLAIINDSRYHEEQRPEIVRVLIDRLGNNSDRNVRLIATEALAYFAERPIPSALATAMEEEDFAIQRAAENSLIALTGVTHHYDAKAWKAWLATVSDPFEKAGQTPEGLQAATKPKGWRWDWQF
ncbi:MAG: hypothetical protein AABZ08_07550 [Planctomycetota bacterium]